MDYGKREFVEITGLGLLGSVFRITLLAAVVLLLLLLVYY